MLNIIQTARVSRQPRTVGFTLVELLVVITIIAVLAGLLFPVSAMLKEQEQRAKCINNLHQITQAGILFSTEHDGSLPWRKNWAFSNKPTPFCVYTGELWPYLKTKDILRCPADPPSATACMASRIGSYVIRKPTGHNGSRYLLHAFKANDVFFFESKREIICAENELGNYPVESGRSDTLADRHMGGAHIGCFDGHVEWMSLAEWVHLATDTTGIKNRLWPCLYRTEED